MSGMAQVVILISVIFIKMCNFFSCEPDGKFEEAVD